ncbi:MAG: RNA 2',3'-cyclic phosphodiesterase [Candidatus Omnitrophota bacterium]
MRLFFSIAVPESIGREIAAEQSKSCPGMPKAGVNEPSLHWVTPENQHFTLRFLGDVEEARHSLLINAGQKAAEKHSPFSVQISDSGFFPGKGDPRVFWIGVTEGADSLTVLSRVLSDVLKEAGFPPEERPFIPHLTIARIKQKLPEERLQRLVAAWKEKVFVPFTVTEFFLMESKLLPAGLIYRKIEAFPLLSCHSRMP